MEEPVRPDAELALAAAAGDRAAFAAIYDRYADRLHDFCWSLLRDRDEAADATQDAFLVAHERLGQLRDPERLRPWLYAVARSQSLRRLRARGRVLPDEQAGGTMIDPAGGPQEVAEQSDLRELVWSAAEGLSPRDRAVLDLHLRHGLEGAELGEAMGVSAGHAYVLLTRLRGQVERALGALLVARLGRDDCEGLATVLAGWDGRFSPLVRKRVARHVDACELCGERRRTVASPMALLSGVPLLPAPASLRERVLGPMEPTGAHGPGGGPAGRRGRPRPRATTALVAAALVAVAVLATIVVLPDGEPASRSAPATTGAPLAAPTPAPTGTTAPTTGAAPTSTTTPAPAAPTTTTASTTPPVPGGVLALSPTSLAIGGDDRATLTVRNDGDGLLDWEAGATVPWLALSPASGQLAPGESTPVIVTVNRDGLPEGAAAGAVDVRAAGATQRVPVSAAVERPPLLGTPTATPPLLFLPPCLTSTATVVVTASDQSGLASVVVVAAGDRWAMSQRRDGAWQGPLGPFEKTGTYAWQVVATDTRGNRASAAGRPVVVEACVR